MTNQQLKILDTTLRDGSYAINFQFTASDTAIIAAQLEAAGVELIEIGHGVGLHASESGHGSAAASDEEYLKAAADTLKLAQWGMFCIPGIARLEDVDMAAEYGMSFIRVGTNVTEVEASKPFIERAKKRGMYVSANLMKSYAMEPRTFAEMAVLTQQYGSDVLSIVDSAGGMLEADIRTYFHAVQDRCSIPLGFHGHNNLQLAVAHSLLAAELGACVVDASLQGLGRSAGNTPTEIVVAALARMGMDLGIDPLRIMDISEKYVRPLVRQLGISSLDVVSGFAQFHSSYMGVVREFATKHTVDPRRLIIALCERDRINAPRELLEQLATQLSGKQEEVFTARFGLERYFGHEQEQ